MAGRDITEGRATRAIAVDVGVVASGSIWQNTESAYDVAIGGKPFFYAISNERPYIRQTAPYRKEQFDNSAEPGEQSLTGWWIRSQSSFHNGDGIIFYDTTAGEEEVSNRFADSKGVNVWTKGEVTLLKNSTPIGYSPDALASNGRSNQYFDTIEWTTSGTKYEGILYVDNFILAKVDEAGTVTNFHALDPAVDDQVYAATNDGEFAYWVTNVVSGGGSKLSMYKKSLNLTSATTAVTQMFEVNGIDVTNAVLEYTKERIVAAINDKIYEIAPTATALPTAVYTHPSTTHVWSSITSSGPAIYVAGWNGLVSTIVKFTLSTLGVMPTLTSAITAAELPIGEQVYKIKYYLGYLIIGTNKGVRVATVSDQDGSITYGQLIFETTQPVFDFAVRDKFIWCASGTTDGFSGLIRIDLSAEIGPLVFAYANDLYSADDLTSLFPTTALGFLGNTDRLLWVNAANMENTITNKELTDDVATLTTGTAHGYKVGDIVFVSGVDATFDGTPTITGGKVITGVPTTTTFTYDKVAADVSSTAVSPVGAVIRGGTGYIESATDLIPTGYLTTGFIRYNTLEPKNFKRLIGRGDFAFGSMTLEIVDRNGVEYDLISYDSSVPAVEVTTNTPATAQEYVAYKFLLFRDGDDNTKGPVFKGYQAKATIATPRQRVIRFPVFNYDTETDRYNVVTGYEGRAQDRLLELENVEEDGDVLTWQDFTTGESRQVVIEQISFSRETPPDKRFSGFGGVITMTIRTV
jgi:hypothetical protein